ncbi:hypothetical protein Halxa_0492 (plasmid) [Halopiger xanaduensis SH-6]|uniref:Zinc-ribbon domain-containing protein n=1 Tax=Halopiger xanaduensis (strain DSM 18323 / JCM 14033 / SH-6) TaxID=797210 RepID=F8DDJ8_HALXS|nr:hypothetical protein Halxa_0492 [Halopiger xanaduensis SH-6]
MLVDRMDRLLSLLTRTEAVYECRRCGMTVDEDTDSCPECGSEAIVQYRLS